MAEVLTPELVFGNYIYGTAYDPSLLTSRKTIWFNFNPASLFSAGLAGAFYDVSDLSTMFQDTGGTTPAVVDSPVARINDKSGNGNHMVQATVANQPILRQSGPLYYLEFDGVNDVLDRVLSVPFVQPFTRISGIQQISWGANLYIHAGANDLIGGLQQTGSSPNIGLVNGTVGPITTALAIGVNGVVTEIFNGASSSIAINGDTPVIGANTAFDLTNFAVGGLPPPGTNNSRIRLYSLIICAGVLGTNDINNLQRFVATKTGTAV